MASKIGYLFCSFTASAVLCSGPDQLVYCGILFPVYWLLLAGNQGTRSVLNASKECLRNTDTVIVKNPDD